MFHSELQAFVKLFKPHRIIPNTLESGLANLDWIAIDDMFRDCLSSHGKSVGESIRGDITKKISEDDGSVGLISWAGLADDDGKGDVALKKMQGYLLESVKACLGKVIFQADERLVEERLQEESQARSEWSEETVEDRYDDRGNSVRLIESLQGLLLSDPRDVLPPPLTKKRGFRLQSRVRGESRATDNH